MTGAGAVINTANVQPGQSVVIFGVGGVGLSAVVGAKVAGANPIIAVDLDDSKLEFAKAFGATHTINASNVDPVEAVHALTPKEDQFNIMRQPVSWRRFRVRLHWHSHNHGTDRTGLSGPDTLAQATAAPLSWSACPRRLLNLTRLMS